MKSIMPKTRRRGRNLSNEHVQLIVEMLHGWTGPLTWKLLIDTIATRLHSTYTRQTLHKHTRIYHAFRVKKTALQGQPGTPNKRPPSAEMRAAIQHTERLKAENNRLSQENDRLLDQFAVWAYNASNRGMDKSALNAPLIPVTRYNAPDEKRPRSVPARKSHA